MKINDLSLYLKYFEMINTPRVKDTITNKKLNKPLINSSGAKYTLIKHQLVIIYYNLNMFIISTHIYNLYYNYKKPRKSTVLSGLFNLAPKQVSATSSKKFKYGFGRTT